MDITDRLEDQILDAAERSPFTRSPSSTWLDARKGWAAITMQAVA
jgi:hypothetical protein